jgi:predicted dehydrogenase
VSEQGITIGVLGAGRGAHLAALAASLPGVRVVAGCDREPERLAAFRGRFPAARATADWEALLGEPFDVLILASDCPDHGPQAVAALEAGKHVLSEVTAFHTPAEGVALVEAVERTGRLYMMAENTCYRARAGEARRLVASGDLGEFVYGHCEYVHDIRRLMRGPSGAPHWRGWLPPVYYTSHPLGEMLSILGARPASVSALAVGGVMGGSPNPMDLGAMLVRLDNGGLVHVVASFAAARDSQWLAIYGTRAMLEADRWGDGATLRVRRESPDGTSGHEPSAVIAPPAPTAEEAGAGHGGSDYYPVRLFLQAVAEGTPPPMDVYTACDYTLPGIMAYRSSCRWGVPLEVPDLRDPAARDRYRADDAGPPREGVGE